MDPDLMFIIGLVLLVFAIPPIFGAISEGRPPRAASILVLVGGGLLGLALYQKPSSYTVAGIPEVFMNVVGRYIN